jgi:hypothetical protein
LFFVFVGNRYPKVENAVFIDKITVFSSEMLFFSGVLPRGKQPPSARLGANIGFQNKEKSVFIMQNSIMLEQTSRDCCFKQPEA